MNVLTDEEKVLLQKAGIFDKSALTEIYDRHQDALYRYAMRLLGDQQLAEDCIADTFLRFLKSIRNGNIPQENLRAYLYRIAHNWITDYYRRKEIVTRTEQDSEYPDEPEDPENQVHRGLQNEKIRAAILTLTSEQQKVIVLKYFEGWQNEEIAQAMGKRTGAVKSLLHRSLISLKKKCNFKE